MFCNHYARIICYGSWPQNIQLEDALFVDQQKHQGIGHWLWSKASSLHVGEMKMKEENNCLISQNH